MYKILLCRSVGLDFTVINETLSKKYSVKSVSSLGELNNLLDTFSPDIAICGETFSGTSPLDVSALIKKKCNAKLLILLDPSRTETYKVLENCKYDVIFSPFSDCELITRIEMLCFDKKQPEIKVFRNAQMTIDYENCRVYISDRLLHLTMLEYKLLCLLSKNHGVSVDYTTVMRELWQTPIGNEIKSLRVFVNAIRRKIRQLGDTNEYIQTQTGIGYSMPIINR